MTQDRLESDSEAFDIRSESQSQDNGSIKVDQVKIQIQSKSIENTPHLGFKSEKEKSEFDAANVFSPRAAGEGGLDEEASMYQDMIYQ